MVCWQAPDRIMARMSGYEIKIGSRGKPLRGWLWQLAAAASASILLAAWPSQVPALGGPALLAFFLLPILLYRQGHRHFVMTARQAETDDPRPPILYLRSFKDDLAMRAHEEALSRILCEFGPFVAIGDPTEALPHLDASRDYVLDTEWQAIVVARMKRSQLVILLAGETAGLAWELEQCRQELDPSRLVILATANEDVFARFRRTAALQGITLPPLGDFGHIAPPLPGIVTFDSDWRGRAHPMSRITMLDPTFLLQNEEASWRHLLASAGPAGLRPTRDLRSLDLAQHWRVVPLAGITIAAVMFARRILSP